ncbi:uncharacterized protein [Dermacentor albipictus]|uniref:uncharacterized protein isoform X2 n=1 Tax=Dermacentor albipictus TaxID=60249 RepID=UPI0038FC2AED
MPDRGCLALHRVCDSVIPSTTVLLPCSHALCEQCRAGSVDKDGGSVCPLDGEPFREDECQKFQLPERKKQKLKAHCWNEAHGCDFVGPLAALLGHFEAECAFHTSPCQRCGENVPNAKLAGHYIDGCSTNNFSSETLVESSTRGEAAASSSATGDITATAQGIEGKAEYRYEDEIPALQSQVNELTEAARTQGAQLQELNGTLALSLETLNASVVAAAAKFSDAIGEASQLHQRILASREEESSRAHEAGATASASCSGAKSPRWNEATDILQNMEVLAAQSLWCLQRLLIAHHEPWNIPAARSSRVSQRREKRTSFRESTCLLLERRMRLRRPPGGAPATLRGRAHCWNEDHGCDFVGPLAVLLQHFEAECAFHTSQCQRCGENIPNARLAAHYIGGCGASNFSSATLAESSHQGQRTAGDVTATAQEIEGETGNRYEDEIPVLQSQVNELTETARAQGAQLQDLNATLAVILEALNAAVSAAAEKLSDAIGGEASQLHERVRASREEESSRVNEAEASASESDVRLSLQGEATDILRSLEVLAAQSLWCHERSLQAHNGRRFIPELRILLESQSGTPTRSDSRTCTPRCEKGKEIVYAAVIIGASRLREYAHPTLFARFRYRRAWCSVTFGTPPNNPYGWALNLEHVQSWQLFTTRSFSRTAGDLV